MEVRAQAIYKEDYIACVRGWVSVCVCLCVRGVGVWGVSKGFGVEDKITHPYPSSDQPVVKMPSAVVNACCSIPARSMVAATA